MANEEKALKLVELSSKRINFYNVCNELKTDIANMLQVANGEAVTFSFYYVRERYNSLGMTFVSAFELAKAIMRAYLELLNNVVLIKGEKTKNLLCNDICIWYKRQL